MLQVVIGIVFVMLLFSLLATTVMELLAGFFALRGRHLLDALTNMIGDKTAAFREHPFFQQLTHRDDRRNKGGAGMPSYLKSDTFAAVLFDVLEIKTVADAQARISGLSNARLKKVLLFLLRESGGDLVLFRAKVEQWFNEVMDRASGWYKRRTQLWLLGIGLVIALLFNVDAVNVYHNLSVNSSLRDLVAGQATAFVQNQNVPVAGVTGTLGYDAAREQIGTLVNQNIAAISSPLGLGWDNVDWSKSNARWWMFKVIGWLVTALAVSLGAPFWFDLLRKMVNMRSAGPSPAAATTVVQPILQVSAAQVPAGVAMPAAAAAIAAAPLSSSAGDSFFTKPGSETALESFKKPARPPRRRKKPKDQTGGGAAPKEPTI